MKRVCAFLVSIGFVGASFLASPSAVYAQRVALLPACTTSGNCTSCDFLTLAANLAQFILTLIGGIVVGMVVLGGVMLLLSAGSSERVQKGKSIIVGAFIGLAIVLGAYMAVNAFIASFLGASFSNVQLFGQDWSALCKKDVRTYVQSCSGEQDGTPCQASGCNDAAYCVCYASACITQCQAIGVAATSANKPITGTCVADPAQSCTVNPNSESYFQNAGGTWCPEATPYCCVQGSTSGSE